MNADPGASVVRFEVRVQPRASRTEVVGSRGKVVRIRLAAPPVGGAANQELARLLAKRLHVPRSAVRIVRGAKARSKLVEVVGADPDRLRELIGRAGLGTEARGRNDG